jgi:hypothetical protein
MNRILRIRRLAPQDRERWQVLFYAISNTVYSSIPRCIPRTLILPNMARAFSPKYRAVHFLITSISRGFKRIGSPFEIRFGTGTDWKAGTW